MAGLSVGVTVRRERAAGSDGKSRARSNVRAVIGPWCGRTAAHPGQAFIRSVVTPSRSVHAQDLVERIRMIGCGLVVQPAPLLQGQATGGGLLSPLGLLRRLEAMTSIQLTRPDEALAERWRASRMGIPAWWRLVRACR